MSKLELDISHGMCLCLKCTVDTKSYSQDTDSPEFWFGSGVWKLEYYKRKTQYSLCLWRCSGVQLHSLHVSVHVERSGYGRIASVLPQVKLFTADELRKGNGWYHIWGKQEQEILRSVPEFRQHRVLKLLVILKLELEDVQFAAFQTEDLRETHLVPTTTSALASTTTSTFVLTTTSTLLPTSASTIVPTTTSSFVPTTTSTIIPTTTSTLVPTTTTGEIASTSIELLNTSDCLASLSQDFSKLLDQGTDTDVEFQCRAHTFRAHGAVVSARSDVIASMLVSDMVEGATRVVKIPNMEHEVFKHFLRYIYTGQLPVLTVELALDLYESGDQYAVVGLANRCSQYLLEHLSVQNSPHVLVVADAHANAVLRKAAIDFMVVNRVHRVSDHWKDFCKAHPMLALEVLDRSCP